MTATLHLSHRDALLGGFPQRDPDPSWPALKGALRWLHSGVEGRRDARLPAAVQAALDSTANRLRHADNDALARAVPAVRERLRRDGLHAPAAGWALSLLAETARRHLGMAPYPTQLVAAWSMLDGQLVEMATGEGKTLAIGLAAALAALAGLPVHLLTANEYLVARDREAMQPLYDALGLSSACVLPSMDRAARAAAYGCDIVVLTAREVAFDYLRDHLQLGGVRDPRLLRALGMADETEGAPEGEAAPGAPAPVLPGLHLALVDEADSILLDEATVPLILAAPSDGMEVRSMQRALEIARRLRRGRDYTLDAASRRADLTDDGRHAVDEALSALEGDPGLLRPARRAHELVAAALSALHAMRRDRDYAVLDGKIGLIDEITGRVAEGRQWTGPLQAMVELKEGLEPSPATRVAAQITYQRFFPRYLRLGGMSGTLAEARAELRVAYGVPVRRVPLVQPDRRRWAGRTLFDTVERRDAALLTRVRRLQAAGRPVLVGADSVAASARLSQLLQHAGIAHQVLNAVQDADEARRIAEAGRRGAVTVATNIAGRGTDIRLDDAARAAGGLHVIAAMLNGARRIDRQLFGRAARHGDPGSAEVMLAVDDAPLADAWPAAVRRAVAATARRGIVPAPVAAAWLTATQRRTEWRQRALRTQLRVADRHADERFAFTGGTE